jgi:tellurite methyltransferase
MAPAALSVMRYATFFKNRKALKVLDYGAGKLRNSLYLAGSGFHVYAADLPEQVRRIRELRAAERLEGLLENNQLSAGGLEADLVISTYVFNIIADDGERIRYLRNACINLRPRGYLLIEVQCRKESSRCGSGCSSHMKSPPCAKACSLEELDDMLRLFGFTRLCHYHRRHALAAVYQLQNA